MTCWLPRTPPGALDVLFVCRHNASRSQMAEALFRREAGGAYTVASAGTLPADAANPLVIEAMAEAGIDLRDALPKPVTPGLAGRANRIILLGEHVRETAPPFLLAAPCVEWDVPDPKGRPIKVVRRVRDLLHQRVHALVEELRGHNAAALPAGKAGR